MAISVTKDLPASSWYSGTGSTTITLIGVSEIITNTKKGLIKTQILKSPDTWKASDTDTGVNQVVDLKKIEDNIKIRGWLVDDTGSSAWTKAWKLRGMCSSGGPLSDLTIENLNFGTGSQEAYLEEINFISHPLTAKGLKINETSSDSIGVARIEVGLSIYLGDEQ